MGGCQIENETCVVNEIMCVGYFFVGKTLFCILKEKFVGNDTDVAQHAQVQNGVQCSVSWLCLSWLLGAEMAVVVFDAQSSLSAQGKHDNPNK